jgi:hypothetical protein
VKRPWIVGSIKGLDCHLLTSKLAIISRAASEMLI